MFAIVGFRQRNHYHMKLMLQVMCTSKALMFKFFHFLRLKLLIKICKPLHHNIQSLFRYFTLDVLAPAARPKSPKQECTSSHPLLYNLL
jgi:hypothetical protein